jgi:hypothetical protein
MTDPNDRPTLDDVMETQESAPRDPREHAKDPGLDDDVLEHRTEQERQAVGSDDASELGADFHAATD